jgi:hypothetical protein
MMDRAMKGKILGGAAGALSLVADVARHVAWFVSHQIERSPRERR